MLYIICCIRIYFILLDKNITKKIWRTCLGEYLSQYTHLSPYTYRYIELLLQDLSDICKKTGIV